MGKDIIGCVLRKEKTAMLMQGRREQAALPEGEGCAGTAQGGKAVAAVEAEATPADKSEVRLTAAVLQVKEAR